MKKSLQGVLSAVVLSVCAISAEAATVPIEFVGVGVSIPYSGAYAGYYDAFVNGVPTSVFCDDATHAIFSGDKWDADELTYADMQYGAMGKFADVTKYSQVGWLYSQTQSATALVRAELQAAVWTIMSPSAGITLDSTAQDFLSQATDGTHDNFDWSHTMTVLTPNPLNSGQEFLKDPTPVPEPAAYVLFSSGIIVLGGFVKKMKRA